MQVLLGLWSAGLSKVWPYLLGAAAIAVFLWRVASALVTSGATQEKLKQVEENLKQRKVNDKIEADNDSLSTDELRKRVQHDWSSDGK